MNGLGLFKNVFALNQTKPIEYTYEYKLVASDDIVEFELKISQLLNSGFTLGVPLARSGGSDGGGRYAHGLVKKIKK